MFVFSPSLNATAPTSPILLPIVWNQNGQFVKSLNLWMKCFCVNFQYSASSVLNSLWTPLQVPLLLLPRCCYLLSIFVTKWFRNPPNEEIHLQQRLSAVSVVFVFNASLNTSIPASPILLPVDKTMISVDHISMRMIQRKLEPTLQTEISQRFVCHENFAHDLCSNNPVDCFVFVPKA